MTVTISSRVAREILERAAASPEVEVCGLLTGSFNIVTGQIPAANIAVDPSRRFEIDSRVHFAALRAARSGGPQVVGHYHSHPNGSPQPSAADAAMIGGDSELWLIVAGGGLSAWRSHGGAFGPVALVHAVNVGQSDAVTRD